MIQAERQIESRVAPPGAFGVEQHRAGGADQDVLGADVAVNQGALVRLRLFDQRLQAMREIGVVLRRGQQVRLEADVEEG